MPPKMFSKFYKKIRANILWGRKMATNKKCPSPTNRMSKGSIKLEKPNMRNLHLKQTMSNVYIAIGLSAITSVAFYFLHNVPRRKAYEEYYANYDADAAFQRMQQAGVFSSCPAEPGKGKKLCIFG